MGGIYTVEQTEPAYPENLLQVYRPPERLYCLGDVDLLKSPFTTAVVGSRKCSEYGKQTAMAIGKACSLGNVTVVSGMAKGIDRFAHLGALRHGGKTIAVLGCGVDVCYPTENRKIYEEIQEVGLIISEYPPGTEPRPYMFPQRNRLIAGLSQAVVVVEAGPNSGALITAELGETLGKLVYSVPGNITNPWSLGTNKLIADGALPLVVIEDLIRQLGGKSVLNTGEREKLSQTEEIVLQILQEEGEISLEALCEKMVKNPVEMNGIVMILEMKGFLTTNFGKIFIANF
ncbi:MAG: DNA-protecting protein DprA [Firmicutes bacterium]|nr:DNA-protecting protein DprA [Bacillota bacterium]